MDYFKVNYNKLQNLPQLSYFKIITLIIAIFVFFFILSNKLYIQNKYSCYGIYSNNSFFININEKLSDKLQENEFVYLKNKKTKFEIGSYGEYKIIDNEVYQDIELIVDGKFYDNEVLLMEFYYDKISILKYILDLFK